MSALNTDYSTIAVEVVDAAAWIRFNRPDLRNTVDATMVAEIYDAVSGLAARRDVRVVVLTGNGSTFSPGANLKRDPTAPSRQPEPESYQAGRLLMEMPQVTIAAINGACAGAGLGYAAACDLRIAASTARIAVGFLEVGVSGELGLAWMLTRSLGIGRAREIFLLPRKFTAQEAQEIGLVSLVFEAGEFHERVATLVDELCARDPGALRDIKANLVDAAELTLEEYLPRETERHMSRFSGPGSADTLARLIARGKSISSDVDKSR